MVVTIDGYSSTGKSTVAKKLAERAGFTYVDSGAMYRAVTLAALRQGFIADGKIDADGLQAYLPQVKIDFRVNPETGESETYMNDENVEEEIRGMEVSNWVSPVSTLGFVREYLVAQQREIAVGKDIVMEGRDIGTTVFPKADLKFFMKASMPVRVERRYQQLREKGVVVTREEVHQNIMKRDDLDTHREISPLVQPEDSIEVENDHMSVDFQVEAMHSWIGTIRRQQELEVWWQANKHLYQLKREDYASGD